jgi:hypothetical protein
LPRPCVAGEMVESITLLAGPGARDDIVTHKTRLL